MYKFESGQISIHEFGQPIGMTLHEDNRWVKKAQAIPWNAIERRYARLFTNNKGNVAKPLRLGLGACILQAEYGFSDMEVTLQIQEAPYLQYFCGYKSYDDSKPPFNPSLMVYFRKAIGKQLNYLKRNLKSIDVLLGSGASADGASAEAIDGDTQTV